MTELLREIDTGAFTEPSQLTVGQYLEQWFRDYVETHVRRRTQEGYRGILDRYIIPRLGNIPLDKLSPRQVQEMESALLRDGGDNGRCLSPRTVLQAHRILSKALKNAVALGILTRNVSQSVEPPKITPYEAHTLGWEEVHRFLEQIEEPLFWTLILLDVQTGLRRSEILGLQWKDVDLRAGKLAVQRACVKLPSGGMELTVPKTGRGRVVDLPPESVEALREHRSKPQDLPQNADFVFCHSDGRAMDPDLVTSTFKRLAKRAGLENFRFHDLRHTHASLMLTEGIHLKIVAERLGHSSIGITGDLYSHVQPTVQLEAVERFGAAWRNGNGKRMSN